MTSTRDEQPNEDMGFVPCAPELAYCADCRLNRQTGQCPRQRIQLERGDHERRFQSETEKVKRQG